MRHLVWVAVLLGLASAVQGSPTYQVVILEPAGYHPTWGQGAAIGQQVGYTQAISIGQHALLWTGSAQSVVDLQPAGFLGSRAFGTDGAFQVGDGNLFSGNHALMWSGTATSVVDLHPASGFVNSTANGVGGGQQVGSGVAVGGSLHALVWGGSAISAVDLNPAGSGTSVAFATDGMHQVGYFSPLGSSGTNHAALWSGSAASVVDLMPAGANSSYALALSGVKQGGYAVFPASHHAGIWSGTSGSFVDLNPTNLVGYDTNEIDGMAGTYEVGWASGPGTDDVEHAILWTNTADSAVDLGALLPSGLVASRALGVDSLGNVVGIASSASGGEVAVMWTVPEPGALGLFSVSLLWVFARRR